MEYVIYSKRVAYELRKAGCKFLRTDFNKNFPQFTVWVFENNELLRNTLNEITKNKNN